MGVAKGVDVDDVAVGWSEEDILEGLVYISLYLNYVIEE